MARIKYAEIEDLFDKNEINDLFNFICKNIIFSDPIEVKRNVLSLNGNDKQIANYKVKLIELIQVINKYDIKASLKVTYLANEKDPEPRILKHPVGPESNVNINMRSQDKQISNPDLSDLVGKAGVVKVEEPEEKKINPEDIPDFKW